jgi:hypothetical protein
VSRQRVYYERGQPVEVITWWAGRGPRNVLIKRGDGTRVVRPFRGLRRDPPARGQQAEQPRAARPSRLS